MPTKTIASIAFLTFIALASPAAASGRLPNANLSPPTTLVVVTQNGDYGVAAGTQGSQTPGNTNTTPAVPVCVYVVYDLKDPRAISSTAVNVQDDITYVLQEKVCDGKLTGQFQWIQTITDGSVIRDTFNRAKGKVTEQEPKIGPPGLQYQTWPTHIWFQPSQLTYPPATATLPSGATISITPNAKSVTFYPGFGDDALTCNPVPVTIDMCAYTYQITSKDAPDLTFPTTITITWKFDFTSSDGRTKNLPTITKPFKIPMKVAQIQTLGGQAPTP